MVVVIPTTKSEEAFEGLHLYHGDISNCSMRVRMTLIEKGLPWTCLLYTSDAADE